MRSKWLCVATMVCLLAVPAALLAADEEKADPQGGQVKLAEGKLSLQAPDSWQRKQPRTRIVEHEFAAPAAEGDAVDGRLTIMGAGGSVKQNIDRWIGQFSQPDGKSTQQRAKVETAKIAGQEVHLVDISGTFKDQAGPFAPAVVREDYRMLGAIIVTEGQGQYFLKFYGPEETIAAHEKAFRKMVDSLQVN